MSEYAGQQFVGIDLHRRRSVIVRTDESGEALEATRIVNDVDRLNSVIAGSISTALKPSRATRGRQACPPASSVSRTTAPASPAEPSGGSTFNAANSSGWTKRWYSVPSQGIVLPTSLLCAAHIRGDSAK